MKDTGWEHSVLHRHKLFTVEDAKRVVYFSQCVTGCPT